MNERGVICLGYLSYLECFSKDWVVTCFFHIDKAFSDDEALKLPVKTDGLISICLIILGLYTLIPSLMVVLVDGFRLMQDELIHNNNFDSFMNSESMHPDYFVENLFKCILSLLLITQAKYLGSWINKKVIQGAKVDIWRIE